MNKKIGLTLSEYSYNKIKELAEINGVTPTTVCSLIIESRISWYEEHGFTPIFYKATKEATRPMTQEEIEELKRIAKTPWLE